MIRLASVFSGIGAVEAALEQLNIEYRSVFACDNGEINLKKSFEDISKEISGMTDDEVQAYVGRLYRNTGKENYVKQSYFANHDICEDRWYEDVRFIDGKKYRGQVDLFAGGSPCQSFSTYGLKHGLEDTRGTLFFDYARLVQEINPKVFIFENVRGLLSHNNAQTWETIKDVFESLNYEIFFQVLDAQYYNLPQMRKRIFVVGIDRNIKYENFYFPPKVPLTIKSVDLLDKDVDDIYYLPEKGFKWVTDLSRNDGKARLNRDVIGCQTAIQQFNWSGDFRIETPKPHHYNDARIYVGQHDGHDAVARKLTPQECLRLMGFEHFKIVVADKIMYHQVGNSIAVPVLKELLRSVLSSVPMGNLQINNENMGTSNLKNQIRRKWRLSDRRVVHTG